MVSPSKCNIPVTLIASNISGSDSVAVELVVNKGRQSISLNEEPGLLVYGDDPLDLNISASSGLPVTLEILEGNESAQLSGETLTILEPGLVQIKASQAGDSNWMSAETIVLNFQIMARRLCELTINSE